MLKAAQALSPLVYEAGKAGETGSERVSGWFMVTLSALRELGLEPPSEAPASAFPLSPLPVGLIGLCWAV